MSRFKRIYLALGSDGGTSREYRRGIMSYAHHPRQWHYLDVVDLAAGANRDIARRWKPDGGIGVSAWEYQGARAIELGAAFVGIHGSDSHHELPQVGVDDFLIGQLAAEHLTDRGFSNLGFVCYPGMDDPCPWGVKCAGFRKVAIDRHCSLSEVEIEFPPDDDRLSETLCEFLKGLVKPAAVFAVTDSLASWTSLACRFLGISVPEQIAIVGCANDELVCEGANPPLSSIELPLKQVGFRAAGMLDRLLAGSPVPSEPVLLSPTGVKIRASSDIIAIDDHEVATAVGYIRDNVHRPLYVEDVMQAVGAGRSWLDKRFRKALGRSVFKEIRRVQVQRVRQLLRETDMTLNAIASRSGFPDGVKLSRAFRKAAGCSPGAYRKQFQTSGRNV